MEQEICYWTLCFVPLAVSSVKIFGFAEYISGLALLVVVFTTVDIKYQFRIAIAPVPLYLLTFLMVGIIGLMTLLPELWADQGWWVPKTNILNRGIWQAFSGLLFLSLLLTWMHYAFLFPPVYGKRNAVRYAQALYRIIMKGADAELAAIADELGRSARSLVLFAHAANLRVMERDKAPSGSGKVRQPSKVDGLAYDILYLIGDKKFCKNVVRSAPRTAEHIFLEIAEARAFTLPVKEFAQNIVVEAIANRDSILYEESDEFASTLIGHLKRFSAALFGNYDLVEGLRNGSPLDIDFREVDKWDADQWRVYYAAVITFLKAMLAATNGNSSSSVLHRAFGRVESAISETYKLDGNDGNYWSSDIYQRLRCSVDFVRQLIDVLDKQPVRPKVRSKRGKKEERNTNPDIYDGIADVIFKIVLAASSVSHTSDACWGIHRNSVWGEFYRFYEGSPTGKIVAAKFRRKMFDEFVHMKEIPNYKGAKLLGFILSVTGLVDRRTSYGREGYALGYLARRWAQREFLAVKAKLPDVAEACLIGTISLDADGKRLVKTYIKGLNSEPPREYLELEGVVSRPVSKPVRRVRSSLVRRRT